MVCSMFDGRIYRVAFVPLLFVLVIAGFSLSGRAAPLSSTLAPEAFDGARAFAELKSLASHFPDRGPGSTGDDELAAHIAAMLRELGGTAAGGFQVSTQSVRAQTIDGPRTLTTVIARRPGSTGESPIAIVAHRDAATAGSAAELSGTAALLELARVFSDSETRRTIVLVSTSGGSGGYAGAADFAAHAPQPLDAAIVLGDLAGTVARKPFVLPFSSAAAVAPESLQLTLDGAISQDVGTDPGSPGTDVQLAHLVFPLATGEQAPLNAAGVPSVLVQVSGERGPSPHEPVSRKRLENFGRAVLGAVYALDESANIDSGPTARLPLGQKAFPAWAVRLVVLALLLPPLLVCVDALARLRRRREPVLRELMWATSCALPFLVCALVAILLGRSGVIAAPAGQLPARSLAVDGSAVGALACTGLVLLLSLLAWPLLLRRLALSPRPGSDGAGLALMLVLLALALIVWIFNPFACLLIVGALHLWLIAVSPSVRRRPPAFAAVALSLLPLALLLFVYARELGLGPGALAESAVLLLAGGQIGPVSAVLWSVALGCLLAVVLLVRTEQPLDAGDGPGDWVQISTRGPASYAGPGSLGGTESALRR
jgi:hypothetical protein